MDALHFSHQCAHERTRQSDGLPSRGEILDKSQTSDGPFPATNRSHRSILTKFFGCYPPSGWFIWPGEAPALSVKHLRPMENGVEGPFALLSKDIPAVCCRFHKAKILRPILRAAARANEVFLRVLSRSPPCIYFLYRTMRTECNEEACRFRWSPA